MATSTSFAAGKTPVDPGERIAGYLAAHEARTTLRFLTCGSVDDGKSTLIGRLLYEANLVLDDQLSALQRDSRKVGTRGEDLDFALLVDGLQAEREQGITIDVAYRYFTTATRQFIVADTPGHVQYTRNMVTGASTADLAVILVDASKGLLGQTRRHTHLVGLMGISQVILAVNKLDLVSYDASTFDRIVGDYRTLADAVGISSVVAVPLSATCGDNLTAPSPHTPWYEGPTLLDALEDAPTSDARPDGGFRLSVQWVNRPHADFRGLSGRVLTGQVRIDDEVAVLPAGTRSRIERIVTADGDIVSATAGRSVTLTVADDIDVSRGDVLCDSARPAHVGDRIRARLVWMAEEPLVLGRRYLVKIGTRVTGATVEGPLHALDVHTLERHQTDVLGLNDIGRCVLRFDAPVAFDAYRDNRDLGGFILIDRLTNDTVAAGMIDAALEGSGDVRWQEFTVDQAARSKLMGHQASVVWLTGLSGAGKSTIANAVERRLHASGSHTFVLDGDNLRHGLCADLGFSVADRAENVRRAGEVAKLLTEAGIVVIAAFISPYAAERRGVRERFEPGAFCEVFVDAPVEVAATRDPKGLYARARRGELPGFTGVDAPYEPPTDAEIHIDTTAVSVDDAADRIVAHVRATGVASP